MRVGIDAGGTFTDFIVLHDDGRMEVFKLRSDRTAPARVILEGLRRAEAGRNAEVVHGSTVATNALLERKGVRTALVTTAGFEDVLTIARQNRAELYNLTPEPRRPLVPPRLSFGVNERSLHDGSILAAPQPVELRRLSERLERVGVRSVAICLLHSYQNAENERIVAQALEHHSYVCASHEVSPEFREYERASTTVINAYVGPLMDAYLAELERGSRQRISILQSNGGSMSASEARRHAVRTVLSGPAGGAIAAAELARLSGYRRLIGFDMGGTSTDVSLCDGTVRETTESVIDGFPIRVPMLDIHTVGAGGGSIARVDSGGLLRVGPQSAGSDPGPACYGVGSDATVTDAQVVLGRISDRQFLGGDMTINSGRSAAAVSRIAEQLNVSVLAAAEGIVQVANANMLRAIRHVSIERGQDPRDFALMAFGGGGGLHACEIAVELEIPVVLVPRYAEALSALGMLMADSVRDYAAGVLGRADFHARFRVLEQQARRPNRRAVIERMADLRYAGQSYELTVPWTSQTQAEARFHQEHRRVYGYSDEKRKVEVVTIRVRSRVSTSKPTISPLPRLSQKLPEDRRIWIAGRMRHAAVWRREQIGIRARSGPALILDYGSTTLVPPGWTFRTDRIGNLVLRYGNPAQGEAAR
jgi:N-methylhydantoinase A/oxoprolinase/acetone carboxylase beta subunit